MRLCYLLLLPCLLFAGYAQADIYKRVDADGHVTYSSVPMKGAKKLDLGPLPTMSPYKESDSEFSQVTKATQKRRDEERRKILEDELAGEQKLLDEAQQNLKDAEDNPKVYRGADGKTYRNVAAYDEGVKTAQDQVTLHERNIEALKAELSRYK